MTDDPSLDAALKRISFRLTYGKTDHSRQFHEDGIYGPDIPDAHSDGLQSGDWQQQPAFVMNGKAVEDPTEERWIDHCFSAVINEAVHEALEHFHVDGKPHLHPHGKSEEDIYILVNELAASLAELVEAERHSRGCVKEPHHRDPCDGDARPERL